MKPIGIVKYWKLPRNHSMACCQFLPCRSGSGIQSIEWTSIWFSSVPSSTVAVLGLASVAIVASTPVMVRQDCDLGLHICQHLFHELSCCSIWGEG